MQIININYKIVNNKPDQALIKITITINNNHKIILNK